MPPAAAPSPDRHPTDGGHAGGSPAASSAMGFWSQSPVGGERPAGGLSRIPLAQFMAPSAPIPMDGVRGGGGGGGGEVAGPVWGALPAGSPPSGLSLREIQVCPETSYCSRASLNHLARVSCASNPFLRRKVIPILNISLPYTLIEVPKLHQSWFPATSWNKPPPPSPPASTGDSHLLIQAPPWYHVSLRRAVDVVYLLLPAAS